MNARLAAQRERAMLDEIPTWSVGPEATQPCMRACRKAKEALIQTITAQQGQAGKEHIMETTNINGLKGKALRAKYQEVFGKPTTSKNSNWVRNQIFAKISREVASEIAAEAHAQEPRARAAAKGAKPAKARKAAKPTTERPAKVGKRAKTDERHRMPSLDDARVPKAGTVLSREYKGEEHICTVTADGFLYDGKTYSSLSKVARVITGTAWNGFIFWGLGKAE